MTTIRPDRSVPGFAIWQDRKSPHKWRCRHRKSGMMIDTAKFPLNTLAFFAECERIRKLTMKEKDKPGTLGHLITRYRGSAAFTDLAARTQSDYQRCFDYLYLIRDTELTRFTAPLVVRIRDKAAEKHGRRMGNYVKTVLALVFAWGLERGFMKTNPALHIKGIRRPRGLPDANRRWTDGECDAVLNALPAHMRLPVALMMYCGVDPQDAIRLPRNAVSSELIHFKRGKTGEPVRMSLSQYLREEIARAPKHDAITLCANSHGKPWTVSGFRASWRPVRLKLEESGDIRPGLTLKGLRHTMATILSEMGKGPETIRTMLGQKSDSMARHYSRRADHTERNIATVTDLDIELDKRRTKNVKPD